jgi:hypothetical protein
MLASQRILLEDKTKLPRRVFNQTCTQFHDLKPIADVSEKPAASRPHQDDPVRRFFDRPGKI